MNYYNEIDPFCCEWIENLMIAGEIPLGKIDSRSILEVTPKDLEGFNQLHFFAGIGGWSLALRLAGWHSDRPIITASCPCQSFSSAGKQLGFDDPRDLWPQFFKLVRPRLIEQPQPIIGEQVGQAIKHGWLDRVYDDLEGVGYTVGSAVLPACGVGAPHIRSRLYWVADASSRGRDGALSRTEIRQGRKASVGLADDGSGLLSGLADTEGVRRQPKSDVSGSDRQRDGKTGSEPVIGVGRDFSGLADAPEFDGRPEQEPGQSAGRTSGQRPGNDGGVRAALGVGDSRYVDSGTTGQEARGFANHTPERLEGSDYTERSGGEGYRADTTHGLEVADERGRRGRGDGDSSRDDGQIQASGRGSSSGMAHTCDARCAERGHRDDQRAQGAGREERGTDALHDGADGASGRLAEPDGGRVGGRVGGGDQPGLGAQGREVGELQDGESASDEFGDGCEDALEVGPWSYFRILNCTDGKSRRTGVGVFPLAHGLPRSVGAMQPGLLGLAELAGLDAKTLKSAKSNRLGRLKGMGNAIVPMLAAEFIMAFQEAREDAASLTDLL